MLFGDLLDGLLDVAERALDSLNRDMDIELEGEWEDFDSFPTPSFSGSATVMPSVGTNSRLTPTICENSFEDTVYQWFCNSKVCKPCNIFRNIIVPTKSGASEIDLTIIQHNRVLVVECKDYAGVLYCNFDERREWVQYLGKGGTYKFYSPIRQNIGHVKALHYYTGLPLDRMLSLVVTSSRGEWKKVPSATPNSLMVSFRLLPVVNLVNDILPSFSDEEIIKLALQLSECGNVSAGERQRHATEVFRKREGEICPVCGYPLVVRRYRGGEFLGCSTYPLCKFTRSINSSVYERF